MKPFKVLSLIIIFSCIVFSQDESKFKINLGGAVQVMASYARIDNDTAQIGIGLQRVRVKVNARYTDFIKGFVQFEVTSPRLVDAGIYLVVSRAFTLKAGRFPGAGVRAGALTPSTDIDLIERSVSAKYWAVQTVGSDFRDYGIAFLGELDDLNYNLTVHNGNGSLNIRASNIGIVSNGTQGLAVSGMVFYKPSRPKGFEAGGYYGIGNKYINDYTAYNAYLYYEPSPYRLKAEVISVTNRNGSSVTALGYYVFGAYRFAINFEGLARFEVLDRNLNIDDNKLTDITLGLAYSLFPESWQAAKITAAYVNRQEETSNENENIFYIVLQLVF